MHGQKYESIHVLLLMKTLDNDRYGSSRPLTNLTQAFEVCTFNVIMFFCFGGQSLHIAYYCTHDIGWLQ